MCQCQCTQASGECPSPVDTEVYTGATEAGTRTLVPAGRMRSMCVRRVSPYVSVVCVYVCVFVCLCMCGLCMSASECLCANVHCCGLESSSPLCSIDPSSSLV